MRLALVSTIIITLFPAVAMAQEGLRFDVSVKNGSVHLTTSADQQGRTLIGPANGRGVTDYTVTNEPFASILTKLDGKTVTATLAANGNQATVRSLQGLWSPAPYQPTNVFITGADDQTFTLENNPYARPAYRSEVTIGGVSFPGPPAPTPPSDGLPQPVKKQPAKPVAAATEVTVKGTPMTLVGMPAFGVEEGKGDDPTLLQLEGPLASQVQGMKGQHITLTGKLTKKTPPKIPSLLVTSIKGEDGQLIKPAPQADPKAPATTPATTPPSKTPGLCGALGGDAAELKGTEEHTIGDGQSIARIAQAYHMTASQLLALKGPDGLTNDERLAKQHPNVTRWKDNNKVYVILPGEKLFVPPPGPAATVTATPDTIPTEDATPPTTLIPLVPAPTPPPAAK